jgi:hypothetical protein
MQFPVKEKMMVFRHILQKIFAFSRFFVGDLCISDKSFSLTESHGIWYKQRLIRLIDKKFQLPDDWVIPQGRRFMINYLQMTIDYLLLSVVMERACISIDNNQ